MRLALFDDYRLGVLDGAVIRDATAATEQLDFHSPQEMITQIVAGLDDLRPAIEAAAAGQPGLPLESVKLRPPVPRPGQLVCLAGNYLEPRSPERSPFNAFLKSPNSLIGHGDTVTLPDVEASFFHFEPELALVIGKRASHLDPADAMDCVFGYTQLMDVSARGLPGGFFLGKSWHTFGPMGPVLVTADEIADPNQLGIRLWVNDELRHDFSTAEMDRHVPELLAEVTKVLTLEPGDVVSTGTHHYGLEPVQDGDTVKLQVEGMGSALIAKTSDPSGRSWLE